MHREEANNRIMFDIDTRSDGIFPDGWPYKIDAPLCCFRGMPGYNKIKFSSVFESMMDVAHAAVMTTYKTGRGGKKTKPIRMVMPDEKMAQFQQISEGISRGTFDETVRPMRYIFTLNNAVMDALGLPKTPSGYYEYSEFIESRKIDSEIPIKEKVIA